MHDVMMGEMFDEYEMECVNYFRYTKKVEKIRKVRNRNRIRNRMYAVMEMDLMSEEEFRVQYRMRRDIFNCLLQKILPNISLSERGVINGNNSSGSIIQPKIKLAVTLRYLAGASHLDLSFGYGVSKSGLFNQTNGIIWKTMEAINNVLEISFPVDDVSKMNDIEIGFRKYSLHRIRGCVMAVDGWVVRTRKPYRSEVSNINCFRNRKDCYGLVVIGGVDSDCRFRMLSIKSPGSTNDCVAWEFSNHYTDIIAKQLLPPQFFYIGDEGFVNTNNFLTPIGGNFLTPSEDGFNYHLSRMRQNVERDLD